MTTAYHKTTLPSGLRVLTAPMPHTRSVCLAFFIGAGSRYEVANQAGLSHFLEHILFKGSHKWPTAQDISEAIEGVGGLLNGGTDRELTVYWCKVARPHFRLAVDVLADMVIHPVLDGQEVERERQVIIEEIHNLMDSPHEKVDILIDEVIWPNQALGRDVAGTDATIATISRDALADYFAVQYLPNNTVVSVAGDVKPDEVVELMGQVLAGWQGGSTSSWLPAEDSQGVPRARMESKKTELAHLCLAVRGLSSLHPDRFILDLLNVILGEGMSSRLFLELRERRGLTYDIHSYVSHFRDSGALTIHAGVPPQHIEAAITAILGEVGRLKEGVPAAELHKAKEFSKGRLLLRMEDTRSVANWMGAQELLNGRIRTVDEVVSIIDSITLADLERVASSLFLTQKLNLAIVGPLRRGRRFDGLLRL